MADPTQRVADNPYTAYEKSDWRIGVVGLIALATIGFLVIAPMAVLLVFPRASVDADRRLAIEPPPPRLQVDPSRDLARFRAEEERRLDTYYWVDRDAGVVHIPIDRAIKKLVEQGSDGFPEVAR